MKCTQCGADSLLVPITFKCAVCQPLKSSKPDLLCRECWVKHRKANQHEGVAVRGRGRYKTYKRTYGRQAPKRGG